MNKIATHNSVTGEKGRGLLSLLVTLFSKCQSKTLEEQYNSGCRYFDIRYKWDEDEGEYLCAHGLWTSKKTLFEVLKWMNSKGDCYCMLTCEKGEPMDEYWMNRIVVIYNFIKFTSFNVKYPEWTVKKVINPTPSISSYKILNWDTWHTLLPIPWLWKKIYYNKPIFNNTTFTFVDFL